MTPVAAAAACTFPDFAISIFGSRLAEYSMVIWGKAILPLRAGWHLKASIG
jgi:hypothetical protein